MTQIELFTVIGSILGIIAFFLNFINPIKEINIRKWAELSKIISLEDIEEYSKQVGNGYIDNERNDKMRQLITTIHLNGELMQFKSLLFNRPKKRLKKLYNLYYKLIEKVQSPYWTTHHLPKFSWKINKEYYYDNETKNGDAQIRNDLEYIGVIMNEIVQLYRQVYKDLNRLPFEYLIPWK